MILAEDLLRLRLDKAGQLQRMDRFADADTPATAPGSASLKAPHA